MAERVRGSNVRVRNSRDNSRRVPQRTSEDYLQDNERPQPSTRNHNRTISRNNTRQNPRQSGDIRTSPSRSKTTPRGNAPQRRETANPKDLNSRVAVNNMVNNSRGIINTIVELFGEDGIDFTVTNTDFYAEALIAEGNPEMYPLVRNLTTHLAILKIIEQHINEVLNLTETPTAPTRNTNDRSVYNTGEIRRVRVR